MNGYFPLGLGVLCLTGSDRIAFVHGQCSNDIRGLNIGSSCPALVLNAKGQIEFEIRVLRRAADLLIFCANGLETALFERLKRFIIFDDVQMHIVNSYKLLHGTVQLSGAVARWAIDRGFGAGFDWLFDSDSLPALAGLALLENPELARVKAHVPSVHQDNFLGMLPQECGLESLVSYKKGCYIGQEIMARLEARGNSRYELRQVHLSAQASQGEKVLLQTREVGQLGAVVQSAQTYLALAVLRRDLEPEAVLQTKDSGIRVTAIASA